ncbi:MAG: tetratricopeptide repeat-containing sensor histidine kinase [Bacteroidia bacterium]
MKQKLLLTLLFVLFNIFVQSETIDSISIDKKIYEVYSRKNDSIFAFSSIEKLISQSKSINYHGGLVSAIQLKGYLFLNYGKYNLAQKYIFEAYELTKNLKNDKVLAQTYRLIGTYYERKEEYEKALDFFFKSLNLRIKLNDNKGIAECNASIGIIFHYTGQIKKAILYYQRSLAFYLVEKNEKSIADVQSNIGAAYNNLGHLDSAIYYLQSVILIKNRLKDYIGQGQSYHNLATTYALKGEYNKALEYYNLAIKNTGRGAENDNNGSSYQLAGGTLIKLKRYDEAKKYLTISENILKRNNLYDELADNYIKQAELFEKLGDFKTSVYYNSLKNSLMDSLAQVKTKLSFDEIEAKYKAAEKQQELELLKSQNKILEQQSKYNSFLAIGSFLLLVTLTILLFYLKEVKQTRKELIQKNQLIEANNREAFYQNTNLENLIAENQTIMGVLAHDLRSPFSKILGLANILEDEDEKAEGLAYLNYIKTISKDALQLIQDTVNISQIYNEDAESLQAKVQPINSTQIIEETAAGFVAIAKEKSIAIIVNNNSDNLIFFSSKEYVRRILDNLISNAIKFSPVNSKVILSCSQINNNVVFSIKDNGPGLTEADQKQLYIRFKKLSARPTGNEASSGLGLFIVKQLIDLLGGNISVISEKGKGCEFIIEFKIKN